MKIKPVLNNNICNNIRNNQSTRGTHLFISNGQISEDKKDYSNIAIISMMDEKEFLKKSFDETVNASKSFVDDFEKDKVMGL